MRCLLFLAALAAMFTTPAMAQTECRDFFQAGVDLSVEPQETKMALLEPDCYAWRLFIALNWPAKQEQCGPDNAVHFGAAGETVWERWVSKTDVFLAGAEEPRSWESQCQMPQVAKALSPSAQLVAALSQVEPAGDAVIALVPPAGDVTTAADEEVRMNRDTLEFVRSSGLYDLDEQVRLAVAGQKTIDFPAGAKEVKAHWIKLEDPADFERYHTGRGPDGTVYGLVAWHVTTKDLPRWFWASFEHVDNEQRWPGDPRYADAFAGWAAEPPVDRYACEGESPNCAEFPRGLGLEGTKWQHYRLKITQIDWVDALGEPTKAVNSKIEGGFIQDRSSCISCHALAMIGEQPIPMPFSIIDPDVPVDSDGRVANFIGVVDAGARRPRPGVDPNWNFLQLDFVWSLRNAQRGLP